MENEILQQILNELKDLKRGQAKLEQGQQETNQRLDNLEQKVDNLENKVDRGLIQQKENTDFVKAIKHATEENNAKLEGMSLTVAKLEGASVTLSKVEGDTTAIAKKLNTLETVTADNWGEINRLKAVK